MAAASGDRFDLIIVGAGIMGSCAAYYAAKRGHLRVLLLEQFDFLHGLGSSHGESRTIRATYPEDYYPSLVIEARSLWEEAEAEAGYRVVTSTTHFDFGPKDRKSLRSLIDSGGDHREVNIRLIDRGSASSVFSGMFSLPEGWIGVASDIGGIIRPTKAVAMFQSLALKKGAILKDRTRIIAIEKDGEHREGVRVRAASGEIFLGIKCVITVGAWMRKLVKSVAEIDLPIQPLHTTICYWKIKAGHEAEFTPEGGFPTFASYGDRYIYGTPSLEFPGLIKIALHGGLPCDPDRRDWTAISSGVTVDSVGEWIGKILPGKVESRNPVMTQSCLYSMTPDGDFVIDFLGGEFGKDVVVAGGFSGHGFKMGPVVGRIVAEMAIDGAVEGVEMKHFGIRRFAEGTGGNTKEFEEQVSSH